MRDSLSKMKEGERQQPYWQHDIQIGEVPLRDEPTAVRLRMHVAEEGYRKSQDLVPLTQRLGRRIYLHAQPYIVVPNFTLTLRVFPEPDESSAIGTVVGSRQAGTRAEDIGNAQAWYYPMDETIVLWECILSEWCRREVPSQDQGLATIWQNFEQIVLAKNANAKQFVTPSWEPIYATQRWQEFLRLQGYEAVNHKAFVKPVRSSPSAS